MLEITANSLRGVLSASDIVFLPLRIHQNPALKATLLYIDGMVNALVLNSNVLKPLTQQPAFDNIDSPRRVVEFIQAGAVYHGAHKLVEDTETLLDELFMGNALLIFDELRQAVSFDVKGFERRGISEPTGENVIKGPKDTFVEVLRVNTATVRRRIRSAALKIRDFTVGDQIPAGVAMVYLEGAADPALVERVAERIRNIRIERVMSAGDFEEQIIDRKYALFPQTVYTERPDRFCANICEGKIGLLIDGFPVAYVAPGVFTMLLQSAEDYAQNWLLGSAVRALRYLAGFLSLVLPAFYIGVTAFHHELLPEKLALSIVRSKEAVPFTSTVEVLVMLLAFEVLIEAGIRLPKTVGSAVSIVGGLVVGDAAVSAKFVSPAVVVIVAVTGICGFIIPSQDLANAFRITRMLLVAAAAVAGLYGLALALLLLLYYLCTLTSFGEPFMRPYKSKRGARLLADGFFRFPEQEDSR